MGDQKIDDQDERRVHACGIMDKNAKVCEHYQNQFKLKIASIKIVHIKPIKHVIDLLFYRDLNFTY